MTLTFKEEARRSMIRTLKIFFAPIYGIYLVFKEVNVELDALEANDALNAPSSQDVTQ